MDRFLSGFVLGALATLPWPTLPAPLWGGILCGMALVLLWRRLCLCAGILLGLGWCLLFFHAQLQWLSQLSRPGQEHTITATLEDVTLRPPLTYLVVTLDSLDGVSLPLHPAVRLLWYQAPPLPAMGSRFSGRVTLKPAHGLANPGGFVQESWLLGKGISATGSVRKLEWLVKSEPDWRERWLNLARGQLHGFSQGPLLLAMIFGEQDEVSPQSWQPLREAGIIHLIAISGMHIGLAAWLGLWLGRLLLLLPGVRRVTVLPVFMALLLATFYTALSGFCLPATRALFMLLLWLLLRLWQRSWSGWRIWWCVLALMLALDPWALFSCSFWLSFMAIALLWGTVRYWRHPSLLQIQATMSVGLLPLQLLWFGGVSLLAIPINLLAIPLFCLLLIPLGLLGGLLVPLWPGLAFGCFWLCNLALQGFLDGLILLLGWLDSWWWLGAWSVLCLLVLWLGLIAWFVPSGRTLLPLGALGLWLVYWQPAPWWEVLVIDVGQGLSVLVRQGERGLLFDAGDARGNFSMAQSVVLPLLRHESIRQLDYLVISHNDRDHAGDWPAIYRAYPVRQLLSSVPLLPVRKPCLAGDRWQWLALQIEVLSPDGLRSGEENQDSCVLRISDGQHALLLTGDLPVEEERRLLRTMAGTSALQAQWLVSGHHGSRHSSSASFIRAVSPEQVIHSSGYANRWGFPHSEVVARFAASRQWNTARDGMVRISVVPEGVRLQGYRQRLAWYRDLDAWLGRGESVE